ncbi:MAG: pitrilysin family protein [Bacteroidota bacterium]
MNKFDLKKSLILCEHTLPNGLRIVAAPRNNVPLICIHLAYRVGSKNDKLRKTGYAHLFEHLMFEGSKNLPKGGFDKLCSEAGGMNNAFTTYDQTSYYMTLPSNSLELGLWLEAERMQNLIISQEVLDTQKGVVTEEIRQTVEEQPYGKCTGELSRAAYSDKSPYFWEIHGSIKDVKTAKLADVQKYHDEYYNPANASLVVAGDIDVDETFKLIEKYFAGIKSKAKPKPDFTGNEKQLQFGKYSSFSENVPMPAVFLAFHCPGFIDDSINTAEILSFIAGMGRSSRLYQKLVYEKQIASYATAYLDKRELSSLLIFYAIANNTKTTNNELYNILSSEIQNFLNSQVKETELTKARNQLTAQLAYEMQYASGIAENLANLDLFWHKPERIYTALGKYKQVSKKDIQTFAEKYLRSSLAIRVDAIVANN